MRRHPRASFAANKGNGQTLRRRFPALTGLLLLLLLLGAAPAGAATGYSHTGAFATDSENPGSFFFTPRSNPIAVDDGTGDVLVSTSGHVIVYREGEKGVPAYLTEFGSGDLAGTPGSIAVDQASGEIYVADPDHGRIVRYTSDGAAMPTFTLDSSYLGPTSADVSDFSGPIAIDPRNGDLLVGDGQTIDRFSSSGAFLGGFDGTGSTGGAFHSLGSLAVDKSGEIYAIDIVGDINRSGFSVLDTFKSDGTADGTLSPLSKTPRSVAYDSRSGNVLVADRMGATYKPLPPLLRAFHDRAQVSEVAYPPEIAGGPPLGVASDENSGRVYGLTKVFLDGINSVQVFDPVPLPDVAFNVPSAVTANTVHLSGTVNPLGVSVSYHFEYSREGGPTQNTLEVEIGDEGAPGTTPETPQAVAADLTGLIANSEYSIRLVAKYVGSGATIATPPRTLQTPAAAPETMTGDAYDLTQTSATLAGKVNPYGQQTTYRFEYGTTTAYGMQTPADHEEVSGNGREPLVATGYLHGLQPNTEYHYRLVAVNGSGTRLGADRTFTTKSLSALPRVYEQVSPVVKGANVNGLRGMNVSPDGSHVMYEWKTAPLGAVASPVFSRSAAIRSPSGWSFLPLDPPQMAGTTELVNHPLLQLTLGISEDGTKAVVASLKKLAPGAVDGTTNLYLRDTSTGEYTTIAHSENVYMFAALTNVGNRVVVEGTPNYSHVLVVADGEAFTSKPEGPVPGLYDFSDGQLHVVSVAPDGTPIENVNAGFTTENGRRERFAISDDASKVFFAAEGSTYARYNYEGTIKIGGSFCGASRDGHYVFVTGKELTADSEPGVPGLYRFDTVTEETELLTSKVGEENCLVVSPNGRSAYFGSGEVLAPGAEAGKSHVYVWREGQTQLVANGGIGNGEYMTSPDGRYFVFGSYDSLTGYDNSSRTACVDFSSGDPRGPNNEGAACPEIYRYDTATQQLTCASCRRDGGPPTGHPRLATENVEAGLRFQRSVLDDGTVIFDTTDPLSALDSNSNRDVYTFDGTEQTLISSGFENSRSEIDGTSADGRDIFFTTQDQLVGQDTDSFADIYDARVEGGIPGQNPPPPRPECIRDDCKGTPNQGPELPFGGSEGLSGPGNVQTTPARKRCGKGTHARKAKGKTRCVKQAKKQHKKQAKSNRRQGR